MLETVASDTKEAKIIDEPMAQKEIVCNSTVNNSSTTFPGNIVEIIMQLKASIRQAELDAQKEHIN